MKYFFIFFLFILINSVANSQSDITKVKIDTIYYICFGPYSMTYHLDPICKGLSICSSHVEEVTKYYAIHEEKRVACRFCCQINNKE